MAGVELMGTIEIAKILGITKQRVNQLALTDDFPKPLAKLSAGRIWDRADVEKWAAETGRTIHPLS